MRHFGVRIGEEAVRCGLVDELGSKDDGGHHARHEADGSDDDVPSDVDHLMMMVMMMMVVMMMAMLKIVAPMITYRLERSK